MSANQQRDWKPIDCKHCGTIKYWPKDTAYWVCGTCNAKLTIAAADAKLKTQDGIRGTWTVSEEAKQ